MTYQDQFFRQYFPPTISLREDVFFSAWVFTFSGQLKKLQEELVIENEDGSFADFQAMPYLDFCILTYQERPDLIEINQN